MMRSFEPQTEQDEDQPLAFLLPHQVHMIDEALASLGEFGEVHLIVQKGRLRFIVTQKSFDTFRWQPGQFEDSAG